MKTDVKAALLALAAFATFAFHDAVVKYLGATYSTAQILFFSVIFAFPLVSLMLLADPDPGHLRPRNPGWVALRSVAVVFTGFTGFYAFAALPLAVTYSIVFAMPLLITVLAVPVLGERVGRRRGVAVVVGLLGVLVVLRPGTSPLSLGHAAALAAACGGAVVSIATRKLGNSEREAVLLLYPMLGNAIAMALYLPGNYIPMTLPDLTMSAILAALGFFAMRLLISAYRHGTAVIVAPMQYSQILWAALLGAVFFDERVDLFTCLGAAIIIASGIYIVRREERGEGATGKPVLRSLARPGLVAGLRPSRRSDRDR